MYVIHSELVQAELTVLGLWASGDVHPLRHVPVDWSCDLRSLQECLAVHCESSFLSIWIDMLTV
jgi:hypothetical protein